MKLDGSLTQKDRMKLYKIVFFIVHCEKCNFIHRKTILIVLCFAQMVEMELMGFQ